MDGKKRPRKGQEHAEFEKRPRRSDLSNAPKYRQRWVRDEDLDNFPLGKLEDFLRRARNREYLFNEQPTYFGTQNRRSTFGAVPFIPPQDLPKPGQGKKEDTLSKKEPYKKPQPQTFSDPKFANFYSEWNIPDYAEIQENETGYYDYYFSRYQPHMPAFPDMPQDFKVMVFNMSGNGNTCLYNSLAFCINAYCNQINSNRECDNRDFWTGLQLRNVICAYLIINRKNIDDDTKWALFESVNSRDNKNIRKYDMNSLVKIEDFQLVWAAISITNESLINFLVKNPEVRRSIDETLLGDIISEILELDLLKYKTAQDMIVEIARKKLEDVMGETVICKIFTKYIFPKTALVVLEPRNVPLVKGHRLYEQTINYNGRQSYHKSLTYENTYSAETPLSPNLVEQLSQKNVKVSPFAEQHDVVFLLQHSLVHWNVLGLQWGDNIRSMFYTRPGNKPSDMLFRWLVESALKNSLETGEFVEGDAGFKKWVWDAIPSELIQGGKRSEPSPPENAMRTEEEHKEGAPPQKKGRTASEKAKPKK